MPLTRALLSRVSGRFAAALRRLTSFLSGPFLFGPGVSRVAGRPSKRGSERKAARPCLPISPLPMLAWRSRQEPSGAAASLTWRQREALEADLGVGFVDDLAEVASGR